MALVRKKNPEWRPSEAKGLLVGETIEIGDYRRLVELGEVELVDEAGNILPLPGTVFVCGICYEKIDSHGDYIDHIMASHAEQAKNKAIEDKVEEKEEEVAESNEIKIPESFGEKMKKAREAARAKRAAAKEKGL